MMRKLTLTAAAVLLAAPAYADISTGNPDLYGWVVEDQDMLNSAARSAELKIRDGISSHNEDLYGWAVEDDRLQSVQYVEYEVGPAQTAIGDAYGSILHSVDFHW